MSRKILPRRELELFLDSIETNSTPKLSLEQYTSSAEVAAEILYIAAFQHDDIVDKNVIDLGTGTGREALGLPRTRDPARAVYGLPVLQP